MFTRSLLIGAALLSLAAVPAFAATQPAQTTGVVKPAAATAATAKLAPANKAVKSVKQSAQKVSGKKVALNNHAVNHKMHGTHKLAKTSGNTTPPAAKAGSALPKTGK